MGAAAAGPALGAVGGFISAFGSDKQKKIEQLKGADKEAESILGDLGGDRDIANTAWMAYDTRQKQSAMDAARLGKKAETDFGNLLTRGMGADQDPYNVYGNLRTENLGALRGIGDWFSDAGRKATSNAKLMLGLAGDRGSSYGDMLAHNAQLSYLAPLANNIFGRLGQDTQGIVSGRLQNTGSLQDLINSQTGTYRVGEGLELTSPTARFALRNAGTDALTNLINAARANTFGFQQERNWADKLGQGLSAAGQGLSLGGFGGGGGGIGTNQATPAAQAWWQGGASPTAAPPFSGGISPTGGYGGGLNYGGVNLGSLAGIAGLI